MRSDKQKKILKEYKDVFDTLEKYDVERALPSQRKKIYLTLSVSTLNKLKKLKEKSGKPISRIVEECFK